MGKKLLSLCLTALLLVGLAVPAYAQTDAAPAGGVEGFVARLYSLCLGRAPRDGEDANWVNSLATGAKTGSECAYGFYFSQEFTSRNYSNAEYVTLLYRAMMGREPDEGGLQDWVGRLAAGTPREVVFNGFVGSQEFTNLCASYGIVRGDGDGISAFVDRLYRVCFNRGPDVAGFNDWTARLRTQTATGTEVAHGFACSQEMANLGLNDEQYVEAMYLAFFDREYDDAGKADWMDRMHTQGYDREQVFYGFAGSQEFANLCARYGILRGEAPSASAGGTGTAQEPAGGVQTYILNANSRKFHRENCPSVKRMNPGNRQPFTGTREEVIAMGYTPCSNCNP